MTIDPPDIGALRALMDGATALPIRERRKQARNLGYMALQLEKAEALMTAEDIDLGLRALAAGASVHSYPQSYHMGRARLIQKRRDLMGWPEPKIENERALTLDVEAGGVAVADRHLPSEVIYSTPPQTTFHAWMEENRFFFVSLGGDGSIKVRLRIHKSGPCEPQSTEFRRLKEATQPVSVSVPSGVVVAQGGGRKSISMAASADEYVVTAYGLGIGRKPELLILLSPSNFAPTWPLKDTPELHI